MEPFVAYNGGKFKGRICWYLQVEYQYYKYFLRLMTNLKCSQIYAYVSNQGFNSSVMLVCQTKTFKCKYSIT